MADDSDSGGSSITQGLGQLLGGAAPLLGTGAALYGQQNASEAVVNANQSAINNQTQYLGNIGNIYNPYTTAGAGATSALSSAEGLGGGAPNYSGFENMPGYQFAIQQGTQAIDRQAAASGSGYTPNTQAAVGQYVTGTAMQDYNTYIQQLQATAGMGETAANQLGGITYNTGANTSQLMANTGQSQAGMYTGMGQTVAGALGGYGGYGSGVNGGGGGGGAGAGYGSVASGIGNIAGGISTMFGGGGPGAGANNYGSGGGDTSGGAYNGGAFGGGAPLYDPSTGGYPAGAPTGTPTGNVPSSTGVPNWFSTGSGGNAFDEYGTGTFY
jgi:hypothetical protein